MPFQRIGRENPRQRVSFLPEEMKWVFEERWATATIECEKVKNQEQL